MKYLKIGIVSLLAIAMIVGIVGVTNNMTKGKDLGFYEWNIDITNVDNRDYIEYNPDNIFNQIKDFIIMYGIKNSNSYTFNNFDNSNNIFTNTISYIIDENLLLFSTMADGDIVRYRFKTNRLDDTDGMSLEIGTIEIKTNTSNILPAKVTGTGAILLQLAPLIFIASVLGYIMFTTSKEGNE